MKPSKLITTLALLCTFVFAGLAQGTDRVSVVSAGSSIFKVIYKSNTSGPVKITIFNSKNESLFTETLNKTSFARPYNFYDQSPGEFTVVVEDKEGKVEKKFSYEIKKAVESVIDVSPISNTPGKYLLSIENKELDQIQVRILDADKNLLHEESFTVNGKFAVVYNLTKLKASPTFQVAGNNGTWKSFTF